MAIVTYCSEDFSKHIKLISNERNIIHSSLIFSEQTASSLTLKKVSDELYKIETLWRKMHTNNKLSVLDRYIFTRDIKTDSQLKQLYQRILSRQWLPLVIEQMKNDVNTQLAHSPESAYIAFSSYMMLSHPDWRVDPLFIQRHSQFLLKGTRVPMLSFLENIQKNRIVFDENSPFIQKTRNNFFELAPNKLAYILLFSSLDKNAVIRIDQFFDTKNRLLIIDKKHSSINAIYTKENFDVIYQKRLSNVAHEAINGNNVLGKFNRQNQNTADLLTSLQQQYLKLYSNTWEEAIESIQLQKADSLQELAEQLNVITSVNSPILALLNLAQTNTHIPQVEQNSPFLTTFNNTLTKESTPDNNALYRSFALLIKLHQRIISLKTGSNICLLLASENAATPQNPTEAKQLSLLATQLPQPIQTWLQQIADNYFILLDQQKNKC
ncbi:MAG: ImcF-related family protein [Gammaproteobacteria bacterium]|nr:ImcF-related family protein [Gammaproteobacteria bacterium]